jgi:predicted O-methyltransferase YrrM
MISRFLETRPRIDQALSAIDKNRLKLPVLSASSYFDGFDATPVVFHELPAGSWSSPVVDVLMLAKIAACTGSRRLLEVGSFRGYTALMLARHMPSDATLVTVDRFPDHGEAYRDSPLAARIERRVAEVVPETFAGDPPGSFDFIFLDAGHRYHEVKADTEILLPLLAPDGFMLWHDYANWGRFNGFNGVPEYLHELCARIPVCQVDGSTLGIHCPRWTSGTGREKLSTSLLRKDADKPGADPWTSISLR